MSGAVPAEGPGSRVSFRRTLADGGLAGDAIRGTGAFAAAGAGSLAVNAVALWLLVGRADVNYVLGAVLATQASATWNFLFVQRLIHQAAPTRGRAHRYLMFLVANDLILLARIPVLMLLVSVLHWNYLIANLLTFALVPFLSSLVRGREIDQSKAP